MMSFLTKKIKDVFSGHERSVKLKKNVLASIILKVISMATGFMMVPVCLNYLDKTRYGIWLTISSLLIWFTFFEIGLGSGLRNKLAESLAVKDYKTGKIYVSTTYAILSVIVLFMTVLFFIFNGFIDWVKIFNTESNLSGELNLLLKFVLLMFFLRFVLKLISIVLFADQRPAFASSIDTFGNMLALIVIFIISKTTESSLLYLGIILSSSPLVILIIFSIYLYSGEYRKISPSIKFVKLKYAKRLMGLGVSFFIIQICGLILYQSSNIIIAQFFGPAEVTPFNIAFKLFSIMNMMFIILITPFWSAFTEAWKNEDTVWIKKSINKLIKVWLLIAFAGLIILVFSDKIYLIWVGDSVKIDFELSALLYIYFLIFTFGGIHNMFINGVGKIRLQLYIAVIGAIIFFPLSFIFIKNYNMGINGLVIAMIIVNFFGIITKPIQYVKIMNRTAKGIWNK